MTTVALSEGQPGTVSLERARRRARWLLMAGAALGSTSVIIASTVAAIAARDMLGDGALAGAAAATVILGAAVGTSTLAIVMSRRGRRVGLVLGYSIAVVGALLAAGSIFLASFPLLLLGTLLLGFANGSTQLSRYASAEMAPAERRASAIGLVVWAATVGAIAGPVLVPVTAELSVGLGLPELSGPFLAPALLGAVAAGLLAWLLRPDPDELAVADAAGTGAVGAERAAAPMREILRRPPVMIALIAMVTGQVVMVVIMAMTPLHMTDHGHGLAAIGVVISAHVLGMFALSPLTGRIADRIGAHDTILLGVGVLAVASLMAAAAPPDGGIVLLVALFLLGYGWNLGFVAGSALLTSGLTVSERTRSQGFTDSLIWGSAAIASLTSGLVLAALGFAALGLLAAALLVMPAWAVLMLRRLPAAHTGSSPT